LKITGHPISNPQLLIIKSPVGKGPALNLETTSTKEILQWACSTFGKNIVATSSFQSQSVPLLHLISKVCPDLPVVFIDTGFHFSETLAFKNDLQARFDLNILTVHPTLDKKDLLARYGAEPYRTHTEACCRINKVAPLQQMLQNYAAWISGVRRDQTAVRRKLPVLDMQEGGKLKINPMLHWTRKEIWAYIEGHHLPTHPLLAQGYLSIGCAPCTQPVHNGNDERAGRWAGSNKSECGIHLNFKKERKDSQMRVF
jgi:phosphoadenosine phosphosulfate reductase